MVLTVDVPAARNTETAARFKRLDTRTCAACHAPGPEAMFRRRPMFDGIATNGVSIFHDAADWAFVDCLRSITRMKLVLKGISTREDAALAPQHGVDGLIVSIHAGRIPILLDGGIRRGTDIFKALALGASAVCSLREIGPGSVAGNPAHAG
jgi:4-hydroxymandelate oxidase